MSHRATDSEIDAVRRLTRRGQLRLSLTEMRERYMAECMAMPDSATDQEQNWIAGHMDTFALSALDADREQDRREGQQRVAALLSVLQSAEAIVADADARIAAEHKANGAAKADRVSAKVLSRLREAIANG